MKKSDKRQDLRIIITGLILAVLVIVACVFGYRYLNAYLEDASRRSKNRNASLSEEMQEELAQSETVPSKTPTPSGPPTLTPEPTATPLPNGQTPSPTVTVLPETQMDMTLTPTMDPQQYWESIATPTPVPLPPEAYITSVSEAQSSGYWGAWVAYASASSALNENPASLAFDGSASTCWIEGAGGTGEGETLYASFDREYQVAYITFKLGDWSSEDNWRLNGRPSSITIWIGGAGYQVSCYDSMMEFCIGFTRDITATDVNITINSVYKGDDKNTSNTAISEITVYGK